jgi:hypothetical protein
MLPLTSILVGLFGAMSFQSQTATVVEAPVYTVERPAIVQPLSTEAQVRLYFKDTPILAEVARCESGFRQVDAKGNLLRGEVNRDDVGVMQINEHYHGDSSKRMGQDISTIGGNLAFARHLYEVYGTDPWSASKPCWGKASQVAVK